MWVLLVAFMISGAAGLFYESVWSRYLSLFVGHSAYAQVITLVLFLGGMAVGALLASRWSHRIRDPLFAYAVVEAVVGVTGLFFHDGIYLPITNWAYHTLFPALAGHGGLVAVKWTLAGALILPQAILLGATFPLMTAAVLRRVPGAPGRVLALFYFANSFGAALGVLIAGFVLFSWIGLPGTVLAAAMLNLLVALTAIIIGRIQADRALDQPVPEPAVIPTTTRGEPAGPGLVRLLLWVSAGTAIASFLYEIAWIRMLSLVLGSATHSFELMLSAFILGLALGALWVRKRADTFAAPLKALGAVQLWMGGLALASLALYSASFGWTADLLTAVSRTPSGYVLFSAGKYALSLAIMLPATFCAGITLPLITRILVTRGVGERAIGMVYGVNTLGSIAGVAVAGLLLLPLVQVKGVLVLGGLVDMALGLALLQAAVREGGTHRALLWGASGLTAALAAGAVFGVHLDQSLLSSSVFRAGRSGLALKREILFHADGRTATVHGFANREQHTKTISTNGKPDGSLSDRWIEACSDTAARTPLSTATDDATQLLLGMITMAHRPGAQLAGVIGHGTGMSSSFILTSPVVREVTTIEIEPAMVEGSRVFYPANRLVFDDPRSRHVFDDAKSYFASANRRYDVILSEPSNPWVSGVSGLFTREFYARITPYLAPGGIFGQWLQAYELDDELVVSVLAALHERFADYRIYAVGSSDVLVVARADGPVPDPDWSVFQWPALQESLCRFSPVTPRELNATLLADRAGLAPLLNTWAGRNSDFFPVLDLGAERARFLGRPATGLLSLGSGVVPLGLRRVPPAAPDSGTASALPGVVGPRFLALGSWLRRHVWGPVVLDSGWVSNPNEPIRFRHQQFREMLAAGARPTSWRVWTEAFADAASELHGGTHGWADEPFFALVDRYLARTGAPEPVRAAVTFRRALAAGRYDQAVAPAATLLAEAEAKRLWLGAADLLDGAVVARLATGNVAGARAAWDALHTRAARSPLDLRMLLLRAMIAEADGSGGAAP